MCLLTVRRIRILVLCLAGVFISEVSLAQPTLVLIANYDAKLNVAGAEQHITSQAKVRNGRTIPIEFQGHRIDVTVESIGNGKYDAVVDLYERSDGTWYKITLEGLTFEAMFAAPVNLKWREANISLDLAIAIAISNQ